jgi:hypothetical protein
MYDMNSKYVPIIQTRIVLLYHEDEGITFPCNVVTELQGYGVMFNRRKKYPAIVSVTLSNLPYHSVYMHK